MSERPASAAGDTVKAIARHGRLRKPSLLAGVLKVLGAAIAVVVVSALTIAGVTVSQLDSNIERVSLPGEESGPPPEIGSFDGGFNVLLVGSDECEYSHCPGREGVRNDVTILVHVSENQKDVVAVSFPRDMIVPIPSCPHESGEGNYYPMSTQPINVSMAYGGLACTVLTVSELTGLEIPFAGVVTFNGVVQMSNAVGGVEVCINGPIVDPRADNLNLPAAGTYNLKGMEARGFLRTRHGVGDGSDLGRISNQYVYLSSLVRKIKSEGVLTDPAALYRIATVATQSMQLSNSLANPTTMISMAKVLQGIDLTKILFLQYPTYNGTGEYENKVLPYQLKAAELNAKLLADESFTLAEGSVGIGAETAEDAAAETGTPDETTEPTLGATSPTQSAAPGGGTEVLEGVSGQTAGDQTCSNAN